jgi:hypothetical protein
VRGADQGPVHHGQQTREIDSIILNGQQDGLHLGVAPILVQAPFQVHSKFFVGVSAVRGKVVVTEAREAEDVTIKGLVVEIAPGTADVVAMVSGSAFCLEV